MMSQSLSESFAIPDVSASDNDDIDSLPSTTTDSFESDDEDFDAQREWERSLEQLQLLLTMIVVPFAGKYFGRKFAYWSMSRRVLTIPCCLFADHLRLGQVYGMDAQCGNKVDRQEEVPICRRGRSCLIFMMNCIVKHRCRVHTDDIHKGGASLQYLNIGAAT